MSRIVSIGIFLCGCSAVSAFAQQQLIEITVEKNNKRSAGEFFLAGELNAAIEARAQLVGFNKKGKLLLRSENPGGHFSAKSISSMKKVSIIRTI